MTERARIGFILDRKAAGMLARDFNPGFRVDLHHKDLRIALVELLSGRRHD